MRKGVTIIIPNYNGQELLRRNLPKVISAANYKRNKIVEIIVIDDASLDKSVNLLQSEFPEVKLIKHRVNRGFSAAVNTGARNAKGEFLCLLNSDTIPRKDFLSYALTHFKYRDIFAVSFHERGFGWARGSFERGFVNHSSIEGKKPHDTFWVNGGSGIFRRSLWMKLYGMDDKLFSPFYWEDVDLSYRALKRGYRLVWEPHSIVDHKHETTIGKISQKEREKIQERNQLIFIWKNITSPILFRKHLFGLLTRVSAHPGFLKIILLSLFKIRIIVKARKREKKESKVSDEAIFAVFAK
ncbi:hypothetical protein A2686_00715 [Candidatus Woesebacteria bacterium RIFCSPHIGHO2_01_FULL_38_10]|uniref:Glycosyltransferase 2-like domain-containing protein n=1 Tax=Candidatus Woesebacteria bacterium RIFCSPLOWO2_01_FULL_39_10b TaxID=1802517 RepID=A0A1F8BBA5_9BACT|nr:MAG: hypothetical protein A2686_00715 [Candidatus Woesebacteria bacterium RIFCSPHIGHO2_01_FULL_38_10]OGM60628.1 MAG: hypothetical protein A2892_01110 [Candidatus Woesebacteria bacterium RIFCSPLOWO2_01_FULL_39_10b]